MKDITATKQFWLYVEQELKQMAWQDKFNKMTKKELWAIVTEYKTIYKKS